MERARGSLLGIECELEAGPETLSFGVECKFEANFEALSSGLNVSQLVSQVCCLLRALLVRLTRVTILERGQILTTYNYTTKFAHIRIYYVI